MDVANVNLFSKKFPKTMFPVLTGTFKEFVPVMYIKIIAFANKADKEKNNKINVALCLVFIVITDIIYVFSKFLKAIWKKAENKSDYLSFVLSFIGRLR